MLEFLLALVLNNSLEGSSFPFKFLVHCFLLLVFLLVRVIIKVEEELIFILLLLIHLILLWLLKLEIFHSVEG